ncbi:MAG: hypothetical protein ACOCXG_03290 [Nanoarchaeota archaeon]
MDREERQQYFIEFKAKYEKEQVPLDFEEFEKYFYASNFFYSGNYIYVKEKFYETILQIVGNILKSNIQEMDFYLNMRPTNLITQTDTELFTNDKKLKNFYLDLSITYKKYNQLFLKHISNTKEATEILQKSYELIKEIHEYMHKKLEKSIENLEKKKKEIAHDKKDNFQSAVFN